MAATTPGTQHVFVYGTLKRGEPNHYWLSSEAPSITSPLTPSIPGTAHFVGAAITEERYPLVVAPPYFIPYCLDRPGDGKQLHGEVYQVDDVKMEQLDILETYPTHYTRRLEPVSVQDSDPTSPSSRLQAWIYLKTQCSEHLLSLPRIDNYSNALCKYKYVDRDHRE